MSILEEEWGLPRPTTSTSVSSGSDSEPDVRKRQRDDQKEWRLDVLFKIIGIVIPVNFVAGTVQPV